jgi:hypothetical protein
VGIKPTTKVNLSHVYNQITKKEIDCDAESLIEILSLANIQSLVARYGEQAEVEYEGYVDTMQKHPQVFYRWCFCQFAYWCGML